MGEQLRLTERNLADFLRGMGLVGRGEVAAVEKAGDGNINWVRRVRIAPAGPDRPARSWIVKQARPALERFPEYEVSTERIVFEHRWYEVVRPFDATRVCPAVVAFDETHRVLVLEDLGSVPRLDQALARGQDATAAVPAVRQVAAFLGRVHAATRDPALAARFDNRAMRTLHGDHIFELPLRPNDFPLAPPVAARAAALRTDADFVAIADAAYARYRESRGALVHGDVQAGNLLLTSAGPRLLDAEIAHVGDPAFDVGTLLAHVALPAAASGNVDAARPALTALWDAYAAAHGPEALAAFSDVARYAGLELLRRTIGAARVEAAEGDAALSLVACAEAWIRSPASAPGALR